MANQIEMEVVGMTCDSCVNHAKKALATLKGVLEVNIPSWRIKKAILTLAEGKELSERKAKKVLKKAGYAMGSISQLTVVDGGKRNIAEPEADIDLVVIGTGGGGMAAALEAARLGKKVVVIERGILDDKIGGTCVNVGCIPSKAMIKPANFYYHALHSPFKGISVAQGTMDWETLVQERIKLVNNLRKEKYENVLNNYPEITLKKGIARFAKNENGFPVINLDTGETIIAKHYVIATGSSPLLPDVPGIHEVGVLDSTAALFLKKKPKSMVVIGGGFIALELGQAFHRLGVEIKSLEVRSRILSSWDKTIADEITKSLQNEGIPVNTDSVPVRFFKRDGLKGVEVTDRMGNKREILAEEILTALGRVSNTNALNLAEVGVDVDPHTQAMKINSYMQTSNPVIYAAGDAAALPKLVYLAARSGKVAVQHAFGASPNPIDLEIVPEVIFCDPQLARVGLTEEEAQRKGMSIEISILPLSSVPKAIVSYNTNGLIKLIAG